MFGQGNEASEKAGLLTPGLVDFDDLLGAVDTEGRGGHVAEVVAHQQRRFQQAPWPQTNPAQIPVLQLKKL